MRTRRSILDSVSKSASKLQQGLGARDQSRLSEYLDHVREIERRIVRSEQQTGADLKVPEAPIGAPDVFEAHVGLMFDLLAVAFQADITRVFTFMMAREISNRTYPQVGVAEGHHAVSHHANRPEKIEWNSRIQGYHVSLFARFLETLDATPDGDGSLLDNSLLLYGSNMSNSNAHDHFPLPNVLIGGARGRHQGGQHIREVDHTPMTNLILTMLHKADIPIEELGDSTGTIASI
jgi:hypothetical protein